MFWPDVFSVAGQDRDGLRGADDAGRAIGIGGAGGVHVARAEGIKRVVNRHVLDDEAVGARVVERDGLTDEVGLRVVIGEVTEGSNAVAQVVFEAAVGAETGASWGTLLVKVDVVEGLGIGGARGGDGGVGRHAVRTGEGAEVAGGAAGGVGAEAVGGPEHGGAAVVAGAERVKRRGGDFGVVGAGGEATVAQVDFLAVEVVDVGEEATFALGEVGAVGEGGGAAGAAAVFRLAVAHAQFGAAEILAHDVVQHTGDGVGAVNRGGAITEDVDVVDALGGKLIGVGREAVAAGGVTGGERVGGDAAAVEQQQGAAGADAAKGDRRDVTARSGTAVGGFVEGHAGELGKRGDEVDRGEGVAGRHRVLADDGDREHLLDVHALDVGAGDGHGLEDDNFFVGRGGNGCGRDGLGGERREQQRSEQGQDGGPVRIVGLTIR